jgi:hypothetical protein
VLGTFLSTYRPTLPTTCAWYPPTFLPTSLPTKCTYHLCLVPTYQSPTWVRSRHGERERERERDGLHLCTRRSFHGFFSQSCALNCSPVRRCCCSSRSLYVSVVAILLMLLLPFVVVVLCTASHNHVLFFCLFSLRSSTNATIAFIVCSILHQLRSW